MNPDLADFADLIQAARALTGKFDLGNDSSAGAVAAALRTEAGNIYTGINVDLACGLGTCAEHGAIQEMLKHRERVISAIVAVKGDGVLPPCGRCRELLYQVSHANRGTLVILTEDRVLPLEQLLPSFWLEVRPSGPALPLTGNAG